MIKIDAGENQDQLNSFEKLLGECAAELFANEVDEALADVSWADLEVVSIDSWFWRTLQQESERPKRKQKTLPRRIFSYAAAFMLFVLVSTVVIFATVEPARAAIIRFFVQRFTQYSKYSVEEDGTYDEEDFAYVVPAYITDGFELDDEVSVPNYYSAYWLNKETGEFIDYSMQGVNSPTSLDTEDADIKPIEINGAYGEIIRKNHITIIQLFYNDSCIVVITSFSEDECRKIAESIPLM